MKTVKIIAFILLAPALLGIVWIVRYAVRDYCFRYRLGYFQGTISFVGRYDIWDNLCLDMITICGPRKGLPDPNIIMLVQDHRIFIRDLSPKDLISLGAEKIILGDRVSYSYYSDNISHPYSFTGMFKDDRLISFQFAISESFEDKSIIPMSFLIGTDKVIKLPISRNELELLIGPPSSESRQLIAPMP